MEWRGAGLLSVAVTMADGDRGKLEGGGGKGVADITAKLLTFLLRFTWKDMEGQGLLLR